MGFLFWSCILITTWWLFSSYIAGLISYALDESDVIANLSWINTKIYWTSEASHKKRFILYWYSWFEWLASAVNVSVKPLKKSELTQASDTDSCSKFSISTSLCYSRFNRLQVDDEETPLLCVLCHESIPDELEWITYVCYMTELVFRCARWLIFREFTTLDRTNTLFIPDR